MKRLIYLAIVAIALAACTSKEQKAEKLIKDVIIPNLYKPDTYKPVKTVVSEAYLPYDDPDLWQDVKKLKDMAWEVEYSEFQIKSAKSSMANWSDSHSAYGKNQYNEAKEKYNKESAKLEELKTKGRKLYEKVESKLQSEPEFIGYKAIHNLRADDNDGNTLIVNVVAILDKDMKQIIGGLELEDYNEIQKYIKEEFLKEE